MQPLVTHVFEIEEAEKAYDIVTGKVPERHLGILLKYSEVPATRPVETAPQRLTSPPTSRALASSEPVVSHRNSSSRSRDREVTWFPWSPRAESRRRAWARNSGSNPLDRHTRVLADRTINTVFIATRHDTHAAFAAASLEAGKNVFVEKPLALHDDELEKVLEVASRRSGCRLMVGYNRRFSPLAGQAREMFQRLSGPLLINYRVNAGFLPKEHWTQTEQGGGRILGEVCHFVDLMQFLTGSEPVSVYAIVGGR